MQEQNQAANLANKILPFWFIFLILGCVKDLGPYPNYMNKMNLDGMDVIYIEHPDKSKTEGII